MSILSSKKDVRDVCDVYDGLDGLDVRGVHDSLDDLYVWCVHAGLTCMSKVFHDRLDECAFFELYESTIDRVVPNGLVDWNISVELMGMVFIIVLMPLL